MNYPKIFASAIVLAVLVSSCKQHEDARRPISISSGTFMKKSIERNKKLVATEEEQIKAVIKNNPKIKYIASTKGYWYAYENQNTTDTITPKKGDVAFFDYEIKDLKGNVIYSEMELRPQTYFVDKQEIMMGLRDGIKLMHKNETVNFLFPSHMAYGYHGDEKRIGINQPLICTVTLHNFVPETAYRRQMETKKPKSETPKPTTPAAPAIKKDSLN
ncbi:MULTISPECIES: gliding motility-associated peptidyl-prolyl isomerase GldI [unclassified Flavobacterium]|uniref:gliding motility-associated peptidyl-prolyl isomerase GldI n=1 Tax=unclassified Flavobacterium TaxID=196869 RepID=UPI000A3D80C5|nr:MULTISPECIES: gliding motility-associated peptidyl-prolyl isomerase GldI [unclassified Flavobacterium]MEA9411957.1 gliding motility-associated peptidyl-prolyl isomerase GldI [Flavobacterium sp. PL02]OUL62784.1 gliding motility-associated peptidyl-prolyl isomerase GldI [Flavobacterium sp. AJR]